MEECLITELTMGYIQLCSIVLLTVTSVSVSAISDGNFTLTVRSSSPAIFGSLIHFEAVVFGFQSEVPHHDSPFRLQWTSNVSFGDVETTWTNQSSSIVRCYKTKVNTYRMTVELWQYVSDLKKIGSNYVDFNITDSLNGYLNATQNTGFRKKTKHEHIFSTKEPVELFVNVTDSFRSPPTMMCNWYIDDKLLETHNCSKLVCEFNKTERHTIKAVAMVNTDGYEDCSGKRYEKDPNGTFYMTVHMKDPVGYLFMLGNKTVQLGQGINLTAIWQQGSPPFNFTWLLKEEHGDRVLNHFSHTLTSTSSNISLSASMLPAAGRYDLMVYVENDVSMISYRQLLLTVHKERTDPEHSPYTVVLSVIGGLVTMTIIVLVFVKAREVQERRRHIETADFDFHPNLLSSSYVAAGTSGETVSEKWTTLLGRLAGLCKSAEGMSKMSTSGYKPLRKYGTMEGSINA